MLPDGILFKGKIPEGYSLAVSPSKKYVIIDVDDHGTVCGFNNIPVKLKQELKSTFNYNTKNKGKHYWVEYTGNKNLANKASKFGIDLRTNKGYVVWYPEADILESMSKVKKSSDQLNKWLESLFSYN